MFASQRQGSDNGICSGFNGLAGRLQTPQSAPSGPHIRLHHQLENRLDPARSEPLLDGCTPAWGEATTGVPARLIEEAGPPTMGRVRRYCGLGRGCNVKRPEATLSGPVPCCQRLPGTSASLEPASRYASRNSHSGRDGPPIANTVDPSPTLVSDTEQACQHSASDSSLFH